ncbi:DUF4811 domain-containing protein [Apilactobacillus kunkeei]|uniref:DUF4811 domain-containing protein n=1 Tax=Apilactobacillus kunkeei TaxID=148814 RepID=A0A0P7K979_9LACO|nr:DUF4811 domain-containing protein [Apilactobacillus kunkeei]KPN83458.1 hypothetical protein RZ78_09260 [Apilactobacillus kunkeei]
MILWIIGLFVILTFVSWLVISKPVLKWICGIISTLVLLAAIIGLSMNMSNHYGMKKVTTVTTTEVHSITPAISPVKAVAVKKIGTDNYVLVYKDKSTDAKPSAHFVPNKKDIVEAVKQRSTYRMVSGQKAYVKTSKTTWKYSSKLMKNLFDVGNETKENTVSIKNEMIVPNNWQVIKK